MTGSVPDEVTIAAAGDYAGFDLCDQPVVIVRRSGGLRAMANVCRHRMMRLVEGPAMRGK